MCLIFVIILDLNNSALSSSEQEEKDTDDSESFNDLISGNTINTTILPTSINFNCFFGLTFLLSC